MWKQRNVSSVVIGIHFGMTQLQFLFFQCFVQYVFFPAYWELNLRSEAKLCQNAFQSLDVTKQLSCSGYDPNAANRSHLRVHCWWTYCLSAAHFSKIKWPTRTSLKIFLYPSISGNAVIQTQRDCCRKSDSRGIGWMPHCPKHYDVFHGCYETFQFALD